MLTTNYNIDERIVESVIAREATSQKIDSLLTTYLEQFEPEYTNATHKEHVNLFICGLLSNLDRKTIEPDIKQSSMTENNIVNKSTSVSYNHLNNNNDCHENKKVTIYMD